MDEHLSLVQGSSRASPRSEDDGVLAALDRLADVELSPEVRFAVACDIVRSASEDRARNAAAIALADLGDARAADAIAEVLRRPGMARSAGTLLYALLELDAALPIDLLTRMVIEGSYEARNEALTMMERGNVVPFDAEAGRRSGEALSHVARASDPEAAEAAGAALDLLGFAPSGTGR